MIEVIVVFNKRIRAKYPNGFPGKEDFFEDGNNFCWKSDSDPQWQLFSTKTLPSLTKSGLLLINDGTDDNVEYSKVVDTLVRAIDIEQTKLYLCYHNRSKNKWKELKIENIFLVDGKSVVDFSNLDDSENCQNLYNFYEGKTNLQQLIIELFASKSYQANCRIIHKCFNQKSLPEVEKMVEKKSEAVRKKFNALKNANDGPLGGNYSEALKSFRDELFRD